jgi:hypothetical protein
MKLDCTLLGQPGCSKAVARILASGIFAMALQGCATVSFATPEIPMEGRARFASHYDANACAAIVDVSQSVVDRNDLSSAINLIDNYSGAYGCALQSAANGRQYFQIPSQLAALIGIASAAFGGSRDLAVGSGMAAATFNSANGYWAPQDKAKIFDSAVDAIECIRMAAVGLEPYKLDQEQPQGLADEDAVPIPVAWRYYESIYSALSQVNRVAGSRLRETGKYDPDGLVAQIKTLTDEIDKRTETKGGEPATASGEPNTTTGASSAANGGNSTNPPGQTLADDGGGPNVPATGAKPLPVKPGKPTAPTLAAGTYLIAIPLLQSRLQLCVVKAKM